MADSNQRSVQIARWTFYAAILLSAYLIFDVSFMGRKPAAYGSLVIAVIACTTSYFRYHKIKRQNGLMMIGDDKVLDLD